MSEALAPVSPSLGMIPANAIDKLDIILQSGSVSEEDFKGLQAFESCLAKLITRKNYGFGLYILNKEKELGKDSMTWLCQNTHLSEKSIVKYRKLALNISERLQLGQEYHHIIQFSMVKILSSPVEEELSKSKKKPKDRPTTTETSIAPLEPISSNQAERDSSKDLEAAVERASTAEKEKKAAEAKVKDLEAKLAAKPSPKPSLSDSSKVSALESEIEGLKAEVEELKDTSGWLELPSEDDKPSSDDPQDWISWTSEINNAFLKYLDAVPANVRKKAYQQFIVSLKDKLAPKQK